jgi:hypothetical protein
MGDVVVADGRSLLERQFLRGTGLNNFMDGLWSGDWHSFSLL